MALREFKLPDPGEGLTEAELVTWHVAVGDTVKVNDIVVEVETAKSLVELPVPFAGTVAVAARRRGRHRRGRHHHHHHRRRRGWVGGCRRAGSRGGRRSAADRAPPSAPGEEIGEGLIGGTTSTGRTAVLVGYGVKQTEAKRRPRTGRRGRSPSRPPGTDVAVAPARGPRTSSP